MCDIKNCHPLLGSEISFNSIRSAKVITAEDMHVNSFERIFEPMTPNRIIELV
jgi:hypothetical protein